MFKFFSFRKKQEESKINSQIETKLDRIIELLEQGQKQSSDKNLHFDHVQIDYLENIVFRLDNIEIDELSGKLIIGNNISSTEDLIEPLILKVDKESAKKEAKSDHSSFQQEKMVKTSKGFRVRNDL
ncbi:hypothetical protein ACIFOT_04300 [Neobacillus sp. NRS-1170]|uniref:hypothetical protein n=1 Tax=Neobacillus sp. NRS-1170 TaxID=3233898 RepID=UPI003D2E5755